MASNYKVQQTESNDEVEVPTNVKLNSIDELPAYLKFSIKFAAKWRSILILLVLSTTPMFIMMFVGITGVITAGVTMGVLSALSNVFDVATPPDFSKGFFLNILLADKKLSIKINQELISATIFGTVIVGLIVFPLMIYFFALPFASGSYLGPDTYTISITALSISYLCFLINGPLMSAPLVIIPLLTPIWEKKVKAYLKKVREILVIENHEIGLEEGKNNTIEWIIQELSNEQEKIDSFSRSMSKGLNSFYTASMINLPAWVLIEAFFLVTPIGGSYRSSVIGLFSFLFVMTIGFLYVNIKAVTKPNRVWEESKLQFLSDAKIHHAQVKLGWTSVRFNHWIDSHECKGLKVFNVHLTSSLAQKAFSAFASVITVGIYFLAREELRGLL